MEYSQYQVCPDEDSWSTHSTNSARMRIAGVLTVPTVAGWFVTCPSGPTGGDTASTECGAALPRTRAAAAVAALGRWYSEYSHGPRRMWLPSGCATLQRYRGKLQRYRWGRRDSPRGARVQTCAAQHTVPTRSTSAVQRSHAHTDARTHTAGPLVWNAPAAPTTATRAVRARSARRTT
jgi:hypothetical protein